MKIRVLLKKRVVKIFIILLLPIYCNVGYFLGATWDNAQIKSLEGKDLTNFERFLLGPKRCFQENNVRDAKVTRTVRIVVSIIIWPVLGIILLVFWSGWYAFCGGLAKLIFPNL